MSIIMEKYPDLPETNVTIKYRLFTYNIGYMIKR